MRSLTIWSARFETKDVDRVGWHYMLESWATICQGECLWSHLSRHINGVHVFWVSRHWRKKPYGDRDVAELSHLRQLVEENSTFMRLVADLIFS